MVNVNQAILILSYYIYLQRSKEVADKLYWQDLNSIDLICKALANGKVVAGTSDTVLGLLVAATPEGADQLNAIKGRQNKPYILLLDSLEQAKKYINPIALLQIEKIAGQCWPGPITVIVKALPELPVGIRSEDGSIAIRIPDHRYLRELACRLGGVFSTSANLTGKPVPVLIDEVEPQIISQVEYLVDDRDDKKLNASASTIIDCTQDPWILVREGSFPVAQLRAIPGVRVETKK